MPGSFSVVGLTCPVKRSIIDCGFGSVPSAIVAGSLFEKCLCVMAIFF